MSTILEDLLKKYPKIELNDYGLPVNKDDMSHLCPVDLGIEPKQWCLKDGNISVDCEDCWNRVMTDHTCTTCARKCDWYKRVSKDWSDDDGMICDEWEGETDNFVNSRYSTNGVWFGDNIPATKQYGQSHTWTIDNEWWNAPCTMKAYNAENEDYLRYDEYYDNVLDKYNSLVEKLYEIIESIEEK